MKRASRFLLAGLLACLPLVSGADALEEARSLRLSGQSKAALARLDAMVAQDPQHVGYQFERAVVLADLGRCGSARNAFRQVEALEPSAQVQGAIKQALGDLCPTRESGWERLAYGRLIADPNYNNATTASSIFLGPFEFDLNDEARAQKRYGFEAGVQVGYRFGINERLAVVPYGGLGLLMLNEEEDSRVHVSSGIALDWAANTWQARVGPITRFEFDRDGITSRAYGVDGQFITQVSARNILAVSASWADLTHRNGLDSGMRARGGISWTHHIEPDSWVRFSLSHARVERKPDFRSERETRADVVYARPLTSAIGLELGAGLSRITGEEIHPVFGQARHDTVASLSLGLSFNEIDTPLGHPVVGISHTQAHSNIALHDYAKNAVYVGFSRPF